MNSWTNYEALGAKQAGQAQEKKHIGGCFELITAYQVGLSSGTNLNASCFDLSSPFPAFGNNAYLLPLLRLGTGESYPL